MTKRELNYLLFRKPKTAFRLIEPSSCMRIAVRYGRIKRQYHKKKSFFLAQKANELMSNDNKVILSLGNLINKYF